MRIAYIAAGAAGSYCGACARDVALARGLIARGHDVQVLPLYTPLRSDGDDFAGNRVFFGGLNVYLQQVSGLFGRMPRFVQRILDSPVLLRLLSRFAIETRPENLGAMTVSVLRGAEGRQRRELDKLAEHIESGPRPDVVHLTNSLLAGIAPALRDRLGCRIACSLSGEESFLDRLGCAHREEAWDALRRQAAAVDAFVAPHESYADEMARLLGVDRQRIRVVRPGLDIARYSFEPERPDESFRIGFLSRVSHVKGIDILCEAFVKVCRKRPGKALLAVAGQARGSGARFWKIQRARLAGEGLDGRVEFAGEIPFREKLRFLSRLSAFAVPSRQVERTAMACLEALAAGVPIVAPDRGVFPEMVKLTGGGILVRPDDSDALAEALVGLLDDPAMAGELGLRAARGAAAHYSLDRAAEATLEVYRDILRR